MKRNISQERRELIENAVGNISDRFIREVYEENNKTTASGKHRAAPAWARPLAASVCAILAVGLLILSIPVVNNIITNRGTGALPADTPAAEQTAAFENTDAPKETVAPVETEKPEETEGPEETKLVDKKIEVIWSPVNSNETYVTHASFNDVMKDGNVKSLGFAADAEKIAVGMTFGEVKKIMGGEGNHWALDDGRVMEVVLQTYSLIDMHQAIGLWDYENNSVLSMDDLPDEQNDIELIQSKLDNFFDSLQIVEVIFINDTSSWVKTVKSNVINAARIKYKQGLPLSWEDTNEYELYFQ